LAVQPYDAAAAAEVRRKRTEEEEARKECATKGYPEFYTMCKYALAAPAIG